MADREEVMTGTGGARARLAGPVTLVHRAPSLLDDQALAGRLAVAATPEERAEALPRWTRGWLVTWAALLTEGRSQPRRVTLPLRALPPGPRDRARTRVPGALALLERAGVVRWATDARDVVAIDETLWTPDPRAEWPWAALLRHLSLEAAPLVLRAAVAQGLEAERSTALDERRLADDTGYAPSAVRKALARMVEEAVLVRHGRPGAFSYALVLPGETRAPDLGALARSAALPLARRTAAGRPSARGDDAAQGAPSGTGPVAGAPPAAGIGARVEINGVLVQLPTGTTFTAPPGASVEMQFDADGTARLVVRPPHQG